MPPGPRPQPRLDDDSLLRIFSKVGCARELARFALVCKRWRDLSCAVTYLSFDFEAATKKELRANEGIISSVLCRASRRAPGNLKHLRVALACEEDAAEVHGHWLLLWATSLAKLELLTDESVEWGPAVWNSIVRMKALEEVIIEGDFGTEKHFLLPRVLENGLQMTKLRSCNIYCNVDMLETILATCPALTELYVECNYSLPKALRVASTSLQIFELIGDNPDGFEAMVHAPRLTTLTLKTGVGPTSIYFESAQSLRTLSVRSPYKLYSPLENLQELNLSGPLDLQRLPELLMLTPMITELCLQDSYVAGEGRINMDTFASLVNLKNIHLTCLTSNLRAGERRFEALNVHLWPDLLSIPKVGLMKALIEVHKVQSLVLHCMHMLDCRTKTIKKKHEQWRFLFELSYFYPDRVRLVR